MVNVVRNGTGHNAAIPGYDVAGKTGTAQKMDPATRRYSRAPGVLSFVGFVPADDPRLAMLVLLDEPKNEKWGSEAAAPIFAAIGREALRYLNVAPRDASPVPIVRGEMASAPPRSARGPQPPRKAPRSTRSRRRGARGLGRRPPATARGDAAPGRPLAAPGAGGPGPARRAPRDHRPRRGDEPAPAPGAPLPPGHRVPAAPRAHGRPPTAAAYAASYPGG